ncbi:unnamed protein product, partial [Rotaria magnacalcarata]
LGLEHSIRGSVYCENRPYDDANLSTVRSVILRPIIRTVSFDLGCYRCKQPGHVQKDCIFNHNDVVHHSKPIPDDENNSMNSTPTVVDNHFDLDDPQVITMNDCDEPNLLAKETISYEKRQQQQ